MHMDYTCNKTERILNLAENSAVLSTGEVRAKGIHHEYLRRMCADGLLVRIGRGRYMLPDAETTVHHGLASASKAVPKGVICLLSALRFHEIGTELPHEVWMAIDRRAAYPRIAIPRLRIMRFSGRALTEGMDVHTIEGVQVPIYSPAKTVADCFKYRNKIGVDVAIEALREVIRDRRCTMDELWSYAQVCRVANIMRPYMEAMA